MTPPIRTRGFTALIAAALLAAVPAAATAQDSQESETDSETVYQSPEEALRQDLTLIAKARGWTYEEALAQHEAAEAIGELAEKVAAERPDAFVGTALSERPGGAPTLYLKGEADRFVQDLVAGSGQKVAVADGQPYSFVELQERSERLHKELSAFGFTEISSGFDITDGGITAEVASGPGVAPTAANVLGSLSKEFSQGVDLSIVDRLDNGTEHAYGGAVVYDDGVFECTSGWTVINGSGTTGVTSAGHCDGINQIRQDDINLIFAITHQAQHIGTYGDIEWKTSAGHIEPAEFYASHNNLRPTNFVEAQSAISVGESICVYGRASNSRNCSLDVENTWWSCTLDGNYTGSLVRMNGYVTTGGDSGGGWSYNFTAYGSHVGYCSSQNVFSVADLFDEALGVNVRTQ